MAGCFRQMPVFRKIAGDVRPRSAFIKLTCLRAHWVRQVTRRDRQVCQVAHAVRGVRLALEPGMAWILVILSADSWTFEPDIA